MFKLTILVVIGSVVLHYANLPVPEDFQTKPDRWSMRILAAGNDFVSTVSKAYFTPGH